MKLLVDAYIPNQKTTELKSVVSESTIDGKEKKYFIEGIFGQAEIKNRNGRVYPKAVMEKALEEYSTLIKEKRALGEISHPDTPQVSYERASHVIESLHLEGNDVIGRARVLTSLPQGQILRGLIDEGVPIAVSTRGLGSITEMSGTKIVQDDFVMTAVDVVSDPSCASAWVSSIMENRNWVYEASSNAWIVAEQIKDKYKKFTTKQIDESKLADFKRFLNAIK